LASWYIHKVGNFHIRQSISSVLVRWILVRLDWYGQGEPGISNPDHNICLGRFFKPDFASTQRRLQLLQALRVTGNQQLRHICAGIKPAAYSTANVTSGAKATVAFDSSIPCFDACSTPTNNRLYAYYRW